MKEEELIRKTFSELEFSEVEVNSEGFDHKVLILDKKYVFRFPKTQEYKEKMKIEWAFLEELKDLKVPRYKWKAEEFGGYEIIEGNQLNEERYEKIENKKKLHEGVAKILTKIHSYKEFSGLKVMKKHWLFDILKDYVLQYH